MNETAATAALRASKAAFARMLGTLPGAASHDGPDAGWVDTGIPDMVFNVAWSTASLETSVDAAVAHFRGRGRPFHWHLGLRGEAPDAGEVLAHAGLTVEDEEPGMWLDLTRCPATGSPAGSLAGLDVRPVTDAARLRDWMAAWGCGAPPAAIDCWYGVYAALPYRAGGSLRMFVGYLHGKPVACVYVFVTGDIAAVENVVTVPEFRRRGIGEFMTRAAVAEARAAGCRVAVLTAAEMGAGIYRRIGFRDCCTVTTYAWSPARS